MNRLKKALLGITNIRKDDRNEGDGKVKCCPKNKKCFVDDCSLWRTSGIASETARSPCLICPIVLKLRGVLTKDR